MKRFVIASLIILGLAGSASAALMTVNMVPGDQLNYICNGGTTMHSTKPPDRGMIYCNAFPTAAPPEYPPINPTINPKGQ